MEFSKFVELSKLFNVIPVYEKVTADLYTPVLAYLKIREEHKNSFLLESVESIGRLARYSFIGKNPTKIIEVKENSLTITQNQKEVVIKQNLFDYLKSELHNKKFYRDENLPDFAGGIVGYFGYETVGLIEDVIHFSENHPLDTPDSILGEFNDIIAFDHYKHQVLIISNVHLNENSDLEKTYNEAKSKIKNLKGLLSKSIDYKSNFGLTTINSEIKNIDLFYDKVKQCKQNIYEGDVFQIVLSNRFDAEFNGDPFNVYRALRIINPSPYMYFIEFENDFKIIGTSPEDLLKVKNGKAAILPIAGTRKRGNTEADDKKYEIELLSDPKEKAEHVMLVDLARNDLGRVCKYNSVKVVEEMKVHRFSHVMHIVSRVEGELLENKDCIDALKASFPAGTVTGAPKIRAIQLLNDYENLRRNVYAGAIGYIDFGGNLDLCIAIRTLFSKDKKIFWQAGAGIVADSKPELEAKEIKNKSAALVNALKYAEVIDENIND